MKYKNSFDLAAFLRGLFLILSTAVFTFVLFWPAFLACFLDSSGRWSFFFQRVWVCWLLRSNGVRIKCQGLENLQGEQGFVIISNHCSILDIPTIIAALPVPVRFIAKKSLIWFPFFGWILYLSGHVLIDRQKAQAILKSLKQTTALLKEKISVVVFPEGTRSPNGEVQEFKSGGFLIARQSKAPLVPVTISGTYSMLPRRGWCFWPGEITLTIGRPLSTQRLRSQDLPPFIAEVKQEIMKNLKMGVGRCELGGVKDR
jgi:1-acyl-sn-glycerol-3-phosphate acyltransferase